LNQSKSSYITKKLKKKQQKGDKIEKKINKKFVDNLTCHECRQSLMELPMKIPLVILNEIKHNNYSSPNYFFFFLLKQQPLSPN